MKKKVLFICTHNAARSQMAEGLLRTLYGDHYEAYSAGTQPSKVNPYAVKVMSELGIDISTHRSKHVDAFHGTKFDYVVTVCNHAKEACPWFQGGKKYLHKDFEDPSQFEGEEEQKLAVFREVRDEMKDWIGKTFRGENKNS
jgi:arsenate reductase